MRLKSIKLAGFKSFVDATTVPFPSNMTAIVGPNGCGKSNIIDAVRWVMGESSAKNLRGESMTDVIFNGSTARQPVGQASIELLFDNSDGKLSGEHAAFTEISIKRKVTREGVSQYYLNGSKCRRRDVTDIFLGTGMGPRSYAIIEQGMIARLIESKPEELRVYLEEAAGISKYKERRRETENRMRRTQENLERLSDIRDELGKQLQHLKRQANAAEKFAEYKKEERYNNALLNTLAWQDYDSQATEKGRLIRGLELEIEKAVQDKTSNQSMIEEARLGLEEKQEAFNRVQAKYYEAGAEIAKLEQQIKFHKERLIQQDKEIAQLTSQNDILNQRIGEEEEKLVLVEEKLETMSPEVEEALDQSEQHHEKLQQSEAAMKDWQAAWDQFNQRSSDIRQTAEVEQRAMQSSETALRNMGERKQRLQAEKEELKGQGSQEGIQELAEQIQELEVQQADIQLQIDADRGSLNALRDEAENLMSQRNQRVREVAESKAVLASLKTLQAAALGRSKEEEDKWLGQHGWSQVERLAEVIEVQGGWEQAAEHVLKPWRGAILAQNGAEQYELGSEALGSLANSLTMMTSSPSAESENPTAGTIAEWVSGAGALTGYLSTIRVADSMDAARQIRHDLAPHESIILRDGTWLGKSWISYYRPSDDEAGYVARNKQISDLEEGIPELEDAVDELEKQISDAKQAINHLDSQLQEQSRILREKEKQNQALSSEYSARKAKIEQFALRVRRNDEDLQELSLNEEVEQEAIQSARERWQEALEELEQLTDEKDKRLLQRENIERELDQVRTAARESQNRAHQLQMSFQQEQNQKNLLDQSVLRLREELSQTQARIRAIDSSERVDEDDLLDMEQTLEGLLDARLLDEEKLSQARREMENVAIALRDAESDRSNKENIIQDKRSQLERLRMEMQALEINRKAKLEAIRADDFELDSLLDALTEELTESALRETQEKLAVKIQRLGAINLAAIDEYESQSQRKEYLDAQHEDLTEALETLMGAIKKIDKETRARFKETYDQVNDGLQRLFPKIFGGGSAHLELTDDDLLETGVMIIARPPGKKNATIHLLSGGEKALTAIALIFAIFELNPAPFCMLDEVDAPLDDANVGRFANMVKEMSANVQFIYISHNKVSMEKADQLMGVTMHEPGVSRLVSVDVDEAAALAEA